MFQVVWDGQGLPQGEGHGGEGREQGYVDDACMRAANNEDRRS